MPPVIKDVKKGCTIDPYKQVGTCLDEHLLREQLETPERYEIIPSQRDVNGCGKTPKTPAWKGLYKQRPGYRHPLKKTVR